MEGAPDHSLLSLKIYLIDVATKKDLDKEEQMK